MKQKTTKHKICMAVAMIVWGAGSMQASAQNLPTGGTVVHGQASINHSGDSVLIKQRTDRTVLSWDTYNVAAGNKVVYEQPNSKSIALNKINDANPSRIDGSIQANGQLIFINPNGMVFGGQSSVNVTGLLATTHKLVTPDDDFMRGESSLKFMNESSGEIQLGGVIDTTQRSDNQSTPGYVHIFGSHVINTGKIVNQYGAISLVGTHGGVNVNLDSSAAPTVFNSQSSGNPMQVVNEGSLVSVGGTILLHAGEPGTAGQAVVRNTGEIMLVGDNASQTGARLEVTALGEDGHIDQAGTIVSQGYGRGSSRNAIAMNSGGSLELGGGFYSSGEGDTKLDAAIQADTKGIRVNAVKLKINGGDWSVKGTATDGRTAALAFVRDGSEFNLGNGSVVFEGVKRTSTAATVDTGQHAAIVAFDGGIRVHSGDVEVRGTVERGLGSGVMVFGGVTNLGAGKVAIDGSSLSQAGETGVRLFKTNVSNTGGGQLHITGSSIQADESVILNENSSTFNMDTYSKINLFATDISNKNNAQMNITGEGGINIFGPRGGQSIINNINGSLMNIVGKNGYMGGVYTDGVNIRNQGGWSELNIKGYSDFAVGLYLVRTNFANIEGTMRILGETFRIPAVALAAGVLMDTVTIDNGSKSLLQITAKSALGGDQAYQNFTRTTNFINNPNGRFEMYGEYVPSVGFGMGTIPIIYTGPITFYP